MYHVCGCECVCVCECGMWNAVSDALHSTTRMCLTFVCVCIVAVRGVCLVYGLCIMFYMGSYMLQREGYLEDDESIPRHLIRELSAKSALWGFDDKVNRL